MKYLIYELFSGVGFCNQLFSLESAIYLANITNRKLILLIKSPLCHCGKASWNYGHFLELFSDDYKTFLPCGIDVYYKIIPEHIQTIMKTENTNIKNIDFRFSPNVFVESAFKDNISDIDNFCNGRNKIIIDFDKIENEYLYITGTNASRCFYNYYTSKERYSLMSKICFSLTHLNKFITEKCNTNTNVDKDHIFELAIHLRLGDYHRSIDDINKHSINYCNTLMNIIDNIDISNIVIMCDRKDGDIIDILKQKYHVTFTDELITTTNNPVIDFLIEKSICEKSKYFIGTQGSTVSNYINYFFYLQNKSYNYYTKREMKIDNNNYSWCSNNIMGHPISWSVFWEDNIDKVNMLTCNIQMISHKSRYIKISREININPKKNKKVISFCLYGLNNERNYKRYFDKGVYVNYYYMKTKHYKDWTMRVYIPYNEPTSIIEKIRSFGDIEIILVDTNTCLRALRFLPNDDPNVKIWISRDLDSILNSREEKAVEDWLNNRNDKELMIMSDNPQHTWTIAGGMFGKINNSNNEIMKYIVEYSESNNTNVDKFANDCVIAENYFYRENKYVQYYSSGKKLNNSIPFPDTSAIHSHFVGNISPIFKYYNDLQLEKKYPFLADLSNINNEDKFLYPPWSCFFKHSQPLCSMIWEKDDFIMTVDPKKIIGNGTFKTLNGDGKKLLQLNTHIQILWEGKKYMDAFMPDRNTIKVKHGDRWFSFIKDTKYTTNKNNTTTHSNNIINVNNHTIKSSNSPVDNKQNTVNLFNMDLHTSVIEDVSNIFKALNNNIKITQWSLSGHHWVFNKPKHTPKHINSTTWNQINMNIIDNFCSEYHEELKQYDGFIVTHSPVFCLIYERYNKPIILVNSCRYVLPYCWSRNDEMLNILNIKLKTMFEKKQLYIISNNIADFEFLKLGTQIESSYAPSLCLYTNCKFNNSVGKFLLMGNNNYIKESDLIVHKHNALNGRYSWSDLYNFKGLIIIPYEISTMSIFEYYSANMPLIFPSKTFLKTLIKQGKVSLASRYFKYKDYPKELNEPLGKDYINWWVDRADFYNDMKYVTYFDSFEEIPNILNNIDVKDVSFKMMLWNNNRILRTKVIYNKYISEYLKLNPTIDTILFNKTVPISIIIPTYPPHFHKIDNLICNIISQTNYPEEVIICASECSQEDGDILKENLNDKFRPNFKIIVSTTINKNNPAENRNRGISISKNKYIMNLDCDDFSHCRKIEIMNYIIQKYPNVDLICHNYILNNIPNYETLNFNIDITNLKIYNDVDKYKKDTLNMLKLKPNCTNMNIENKWIHHAHIVFNKEFGIRFNETKEYFKREDGKLCQDFLLNDKYVIYIDAKLTLYKPQ